MMDCPLELNPDGLWQCPQCKWVYKLKSAKPPRRNCPKALPAMIAEFDRLMEIGDDAAADDLANKLICYEMRRRTGKPCKPCAKESA